MKRLRKHSGQKIRYFHCGEYGEKNSRPHYHTLLFGYVFSDAKLWTIRNGHQLYRSETLERLWPFGHSLIGELTFESAAYCARYCLKKFHESEATPEELKRHYEICDPDTGEIHDLEPEYCTMSRNPGIGADWFHKYKKDTNKDYITVNRMKMRLPKFYDQLIEREDELEILNRKRKRKNELKKRAHDNTPERLRARKKVKQTQAKILIRGYENET